jgi:molybdopterin synthase catalytic subunit
VRFEVRVQREDFSVAEEYAALRARLPGHGGAIATFTGLVRDRDDPTLGQDKPVQTLHLEHYPGMTERSIEAIARQAEERWPLLDLLVIHRVGPLAPEAQIVYVQVASAHRAAAFAACAFVMDYLKTDAVFWKREDTVEGSRWVESTRDDRQRVSDWQAGNRGAS